MTKTEIHHKMRSRKRYGHHQKRTHQFLQTYLPYVPLFLIISSIIGLSFTKLPFRRGVLSYTTDISVQNLLLDTNQQRLANNVAALTLNKQLDVAAQAKADDMAKRNYWSHNTPDGNTPWVFIQQAGYHYQKAGENLAYGFATTSDTITGWMNSPHHRENLLDPAFQDVGFGFANVPDYQNNGQETVVVAMYGRPAMPSLTLTQAPGISLNTVTPTGLSTTLAAATEKSSQEPAAKGIALAQLLTRGYVPWIDGVVLLATLACLAMMLVRHGNSLRKTWLKGEKFVLRHPLFDITVISFLGLCVLLSQTIGVIR